MIGYYSGTFMYVNMFDDKFSDNALERKWYLRARESSRRKPYLTALVKRTVIVRFIMLAEFIVAPNFEVPQIHLPVYLGLK